MKYEGKYWTVRDGRGLYICAPAGYALDFSTGRVYRDGTCPRKSGPEMTRDSMAAFRFRSYAAARRQAGKLGEFRISEH